MVVHINPGLNATVITFTLFESSELWNQSAPHPPSHVDLWLWETADDKSLFSLLIIGNVYVFSLSGALNNTVIWIVSVLVYQGKTHSTIWRKDLHTVSLLPSISKTLEKAVFAQLSAQNVTLLDPSVELCLLIKVILLDVIWSEKMMDGLQNFQVVMVVFLLLNAGLVKYW